MDETEIIDEIKNEDSYDNENSYNNEELFNMDDLTDEEYSLYEEKLRCLKEGNMGNE